MTMKTTVPVSESARIVCLPDPDGFFIETVERMPPSSDGAQFSGNIGGDAPGNVTLRPRSPAA